jgi:hypothetical protein
MVIQTAKFDVAMKKECLCDASSRYTALTPVWCLSLLAFASLVCFPCDGVQEAQNGSQSVDRLMARAI